MDIQEVIKDLAIKSRKFFISPHSVNLINWSSLPTGWEWEKRRITLYGKYKANFGGIRGIKSLIMFLCMFSYFVFVILANFTLNNNYFLIFALFLIIKVILLSSERNYLYINSLPEGEIGKLTLYYNIYLFVCIQILMIGILVFSLWVLTIEYINTDLNLLYGVSFLVFSFFAISSSTFLIYYFNISKPLWDWGKARVTNIQMAESNKTLEDYSSEILEILIFESQVKHFGQSIDKIAMLMGVSKDSFYEKIIESPKRLNFGENFLIRLPSLVSVFVYVFNLSVNYNGESIFEIILGIFKSK
ncbi:MAG: hypothetical protein MUF87_19775 [Anaerolineae bacterium]|jgi:hypothetical protein|nr:hypothetical protein [Anaerolineae bacterium]